MLVGIIFMQTNYRSWSSLFSRQTFLSVTAVSNDTIGLVQRKDGASSARSYSYTIVNYEEEYQKWAAKDNQKDAEGGAEALGFPVDDVREISRERMLPPELRTLPTSATAAAKTAPHLHAVQTALTLYSSDWRGVERYYRNAAVRPERGQTSQASATYPLFENGPNVVLPEYLDDETAELGTDTVDPSEGVFGDDPASDASSTSADTDSFGRLVDEWKQQSARVRRR